MSRTGGKGALVAEKILDFLVPAAHAADLSPSSLTKGSHEAKPKTTEMVFSREGKTFVGFVRGLKDSFMEAGTFLGEEAAWFRLGEPTKVGKTVKATGIFLGEEAARIRLDERTKTGNFIRTTGTFIGEEAARFHLGEETEIGRKFEKLSLMPADELTYHVGKGLGDAFLGFAALRGAGLASNAAGDSLTWSYQNLKKGEVRKLFDILKPKNTSLLYYGIKSDSLIEKLPSIEEVVKARTPKKK